MSTCTFRKIFPNKHTLLAVVSVTNEEQAVRDAHIAQTEGADGVFLTSNNVLAHNLIRICNAVKRKLPSYWVGLKYHEFDWSAVVVIPREASGLWAYNAGMNGADTSILKTFKTLRQHRPWGGIYFGGMDSNGAEAAQIAVPFVDVITARNVKTGVIPDIEQIRLLRNAVGNHPLAIAGGITPENTQQYAPYVDCFLVTAGISDFRAELDPALVRQCVSALGK